MASLQPYTFRNREIELNNFLPWIAPIEIKEQAAYFWEFSKDLIHLNINYQNFSGLEDQFTLDKNNIAVCDLQRGIAASLEKSLGSGRSCFYKGLYFKGIGRTPLVKSWVDTEDILHSNGLLFPSGAIREVAFSLFTKRISHCINPVRSLSLATGTNYSQMVATKLYANSDVRADAVESSYVGQTIKEGNFIRFSNIKWLTGNMGTFFVNQNEFRTIEFLFSCIDHGLQKKHHDSMITPTARSPRNIFQDLFEGVINAVKNVIELNSYGVKLGSLGNNFALDGRFIDLEVPVFVGSHQLCTHLPQERHSLSEVFECLGALFQYRLYLEEFGQWLKHAGENSPFQNAKIYLKHLHEEFQTEAKNYLWLWEDEKVAQLIKDFYLKQNIQISQKAIVLIKIALMKPYYSFSIDELGKTNPIEMNFPHYQTGLSPKCFSIPALIESSTSPDLHRSTIVNEYLNDITTYKNHDQVFAGLTKLNETLDN